MNQSHVRKASENRPVGYLRTELRAQQRQEYDQSVKEKERQANLQRQAYEQEKARKQEEEHQRIRTKSTFKAQPIKHYKPVEVKPSELPLTEPHSPPLKAHQNLSGMFKNANVSSNGGENVSVSKGMSKRYGMSQEDLRAGNY